MTTGRILEAIARHLSGQEHGGQLIVTYRPNDSEGPWLITVVRTHWSDHLSDVTTSDTSITGDDLFDTARKMGRRLNIPPGVDSTDASADIYRNVMPEQPKGPNA